MIERLKIQASINDSGYGNGNLVFDCGTPIEGEIRLLRLTQKTRIRIEKSSDSEKSSTAVQRGNEKPEYIVFWFLPSSRE